MSRLALPVPTPQELADILHAPDPDGHYGVPISLAELAAANHGAAEMLLQAPRQVPRRGRRRRSFRCLLHTHQTSIVPSPPLPLQVLPLLDLALVLAQEQLRERAGHRDPEQGPPAKPWVHARLHGLALHQDVLAREVCPPAGGVGAPHIDRLLTLAGTVTKAGPVKALEARRVYECGRCHHRHAPLAGCWGGRWVLGAGCWAAGAGGEAQRSTGMVHVNPHNCGSLPAAPANLPPSCQRPLQVCGAGRHRAGRHSGAAARVPFRERQAVPRHRLQVPGRLGAGRSSGTRLRALPALLDPPLHCSRPAAVAALPP